MVGPADLLRGTSRNVGRAIFTVEALCVACGFPKRGWAVVHLFVRIRLRKGSPSTRSFEIRVAVPWRNEEALDTTTAIPAPHPSRRRKGDKPLPERSREVVFASRDRRVYYMALKAVAGISLDVTAKRSPRFIGPSGCGKSTLLRCFNRMNDLVPDRADRGAIMFHGHDLYGPSVDPVELRRRIGMVFQKPNPFPKSIFDNVAFGPRING